MKRLIAAGCCLLIIVTFCLIGNGVVHNICNNISEKATLCESQPTEKNAAELKDYFFEKRGLMTVFINHDTVQDMEVSVFLINEYLKKDMMNEYQSECLKLIQYSDDVDFSGRITGETLF